MKKSIKNMLLAAGLLLLPTTLFSQSYGQQYTIQTADGEQKVTIEARNCDFVFELEGATAYASFYETEDGDVYCLSKDGWVPATKKQAKFVKKAEKQCQPYEMTTYYGKVADGPAGDLVWMSDSYKKDKSLNWLDYAIIPLSSELSTPGHLVDAAYGTFYTSCLMEDGTCVTCKAKIDCYLYNNEFYLLESDVTGYENQLYIINRMFQLQLGVYTEDDVPEELVAFASTPILPQFIAESVWNNTIESSEGYPLYESFDPENGYIALYLDVMRQYQLPLLYSDVILCFGYDYEGRNLQMIDAETGNAIAAKGLELAESGMDMNNLLDAAIKSQGLGMETLVIDPDTIHLFDLESFGVIIPFWDYVVPGNILADTRNEDNPFALVVSVADEIESRNDISVLYYDDKQGCIIQCTWEELERPEHYTVRHLLDTRSTNE